MANEAQVTSTPPAIDPNTTQQSSGGTPAAPAVAPPAAAAPAAPVVQTAHVPTRKLIESDDGDIPDDAEVLEFKPKTFKSRLERHANSVLTKKLAEVGVQNMDEVSQKLAKLKEIEAQEEERRLAQLSEVERLKEENAKIIAERDEAKTAHEQYVLQQQYREVDTEVNSIGARYVDEKYMRMVTRELEDHVKKTSEAAIGDDPSAYIDGWFKEFIEKNPAFGKAASQAQRADADAAAAASDAAAAATAAAKQRVAITPIQNGGLITAPITQDVRAPGSNGTSTAAPGKANSMTDQEWREFKRSQGWT